jgi:hypothetical protein
MQHEQEPMMAEVPPAEQYGHVKISRKAYDADPFWNEPREFSRWEAWEYMIQAASFKPTRWSDGQGIVELQRGETPPRSLRYLAREWRWSVKKVRVFLELLQEVGRIRAQQSTAQGHTYRLVNYRHYQGQGHSEGTAKGTAGAQAGHKSEAVKKNTTTTPIQKRARALPDDWTPNADHQRIATEEGRSLIREVEKFRDNARAKGRKQLDWDAAFRNWLRSDYGRKNGRHDSGGTASEGRSQASGSRTGTDDYDHLGG